MRSKARLSIGCCCSLTVVAAMLAGSQRAQAAAGDVVISQVYGGGGGTGSPYVRDYVELYNRSAAAVDISNWSVQYAASTGTSWSVTAIPAATPLLQPGKYFLIWESTDGTTPVPESSLLPANDIAVPGTINLASTTGKVALLSNTTAITSGNGTPLSSAFPALQDFVGYGTGANWNEPSTGGTAFAAANNAPGGSFVNSTYRRGCGSIDTNTNKNDWAVGFPSPRNNATPANLGLSGIGFASPNLLLATQTVRLQATPRLCGGATPLNAGTTVTVDVGLITTGVAGSPVALVDNATNGDEVANDGVYSRTVVIGAAIVAGSKNLPVTYADGSGNSGGSYITVEVLPVGTPANDDCATAQNIVGPYTGAGVSVAGNLTGANVEYNIIIQNAGLGAIAMTSRRGVWYTVIGTGTTLNADLCSSAASFNSVMMVMCGTCDGLTVVTSNDDGCGVTSGLSSADWCSISGTTYYIWVANSAVGAATNAFTLRITDSGLCCTGGVVCDTCQPVCAANAIREDEAGYGIHNNDGCDSTPNLFTDLGSLDNVTVRNICGTANGYSDSRDTDWFRFTAANTGTFSAVVTGQQPIQVALESLTGASPGACPATVIALSAANNRCGPAGVSGAVTAGVSYAIRIIHGPTPATTFGGVAPSGTGYRYSGLLKIDGVAGACCVNGNCISVNVDACNSAGGNYRGDNIPCSPLNLCKGACCTSTCCVLTNADPQAPFVLGTTSVACNALSGLYKGDGSVCVVGSTTFPFTVANTNAALDDITTQGGIDTLFTGDDSVSVAFAFPQGFAFPYFGTSYGRYLLSTNGLLGFPVLANGITGTAGDVTFPNATAPNLIMSAYWDDLNVNGAAPPNQNARILTLLKGVAPNRQFIVQWNNVVTFGTTITNKFQVILNENGCFEFRYGAVNPIGYTGTVPPAFHAGFEDAAGGYGIDVPMAQIGSGGTAAARLFCPPNACPPTGACCQGTNCAVITRAVCTSTIVGGTYQGDNISCSPNPCTPPGACCANGACTFTTVGACNVLNGIFRGEGVTCTASGTNPGPGTPCQGACCRPDGSCALVNSVGGANDPPTNHPNGSPNVNCSAFGAGSLYRGDGSICTGTGAVTCAQPGRCCNPDGSCTVVLQAQCPNGSLFTPAPANCLNPSQTFGGPSPATVAIPSVGAAPPSIINVPASFTIADLNVRVKIQHTWRGDCAVCLQPPSGPPIHLTTTDATTCASTATCDSGEDDLNCIFDDQSPAVAMSTICASGNLLVASATPDSVFTIPAGQLAAANGLNVNGNWTLLVTDDTSGDSGTLLDWSLIATPTGSPCPQPLVACCIANAPFCVLATSADCFAQNGAPQPYPSTCPFNGCPVPARCCFCDGHCASLFPSTCTSQGGSPGASGSECEAAGDPPVCPQPSACCVGATCQFVSVPCCNNLGGVSVPGKNCQDTPPPCSSGACCLVDGTCADRIAGNCVHDPLFVSFTGGVTCASNPNRCKGRCCHGDGTCTLESAANCQAPNRFGGVGTSSCAAPPVPSLCGNPFEDISLDAGATQVPLATLASCSATFTPQDEGVANLPIPFTFVYYGVPQNTVTYSADGIATFAPFAGCLFTTHPLPTAGATIPHAIIAGLWGDRDTVDGLPHYFYETLGVAGSRRFIMEWKNVGDFSAGANPKTFEIILFEGSNCIEIRIQTTAGATGVTGDENYDGTVGFTFPAAQVVNGACLRLCPSSPCVGACCIGTGATATCQVLSSDDCAALVPPGSYRGDATTCSPNPCVPQGACCNGTLCSIQGQLDCTNAGGTYGGDTSTCASPAPCQVPCCKNDGTCDLRTLTSCLSLQGAVPGAPGTPCPAAPCLPTGACCRTDHTCAVRTQFGCSADPLFHNWIAGATCTPNNCVGRCCHANGTCTLEFAIDCPAPANTYGGDGTTCSANGNECKGQCCHPNGTCTLEGPGNCPVPPNLYAGLGTTCGGGGGSYALSQIPVNFTDISVSGTAVALVSGTDDGDSAAIPMPFAFSFYGSPVTQYWINANGFMTFTDPLGGSFFTSSDLPSAGTPNSAIYGLWDDLYQVTTGTTKSQVLGATPNQVLTIQWTAVPQYQTGPSSTFQIKLFEANSSIEMHYTVVGTEDSAAGGTNGDNFTTTVGVEDATGTQALQAFPPGTGTRAALQALMANAQALRFTFVPPTSSCPPSGRCCGTDGSCQQTFEIGCPHPPNSWTPGADCTPALSVSTCDAGTGSFEDISGTGAPVTLNAFGGFDADDEGSSNPLTIPFSFNFYGTSYTSYVMSSNGFITFDPASYTAADFGGPGSMGNAPAPNSVVAALWADLGGNPPQSGGHWVTQTLGVAGSRRHIVQWTNVEHFGVGDSNTFQIVLYEGTNCIRIRYLAVGPGGGAAGIENQAGGNAITVPAAQVVSGGCAQICVTPACPPAGRCCLTDGSCQTVTQVACTANPLYYSWTAGLNCTDNPCPPLGRCCLTNGSCQSPKSQADCTANPLYYSWAAGLNCTDNPCPPLGRCCLSSGCQKLTSDDCNALAGHIAWVAGLDCSTPCCVCYGDLGGGPADAADGLVNGRDIQKFARCIVTAGGAGCECADVNHTGGVNQGDVSGFISAVLTSSCAP